MNGIGIDEARAIGGLRLPVVGDEGDVPVVDVRLRQLVLQIDLLHTVKVILAEELEGIVDAILKLLVCDVDLNYGVSVCPKSVLF